MLALSWYDISHAIMLRGGKLAHQQHCQLKWPPAIAVKGNSLTMVAKQHLIMFTQVANGMCRLLW